ncbi:MAG TPA: 16S rRNA (guanine(527)-N(7))-methyltransferase RsmG [Syntrophales bacterium]|jgi:16S rRNA (guanine527-N7)-methyltransferase|nr:16S rRNA (guanine(527)-N(7))-methyltransferase RsmG [Syntrophales bacterium]HRT61800.1 16S rRNA (guanine(527)-N(7))-methyltransferase RsmG [Syntrophales bacterium]
MSPADESTGLAEILSGASALTGLVPGEKEISLLESYRKAILFWNSKMSLLALRSPPDLTVKHFVDSLTVAPYLPGEDARVLDIGTGAGFPGIPLKIFMGSLRLWLLESRRKKVSFLKHVVRELGLREVTVIHRRTEDLIAEGSCKAFFDAVVSRALWKLCRLIPAGGHFLSTGGVLIAMKGADIEEELRDALDLCPAHGMAFVAAHELTLPGEAGRRKIVLFRKV